MAGTAAAIAQAAEIRDRELADVDKKEEASYAKLLEKYETYQQGRLRIARKYDQDIAALASNPEAQQLAREAKQKALDDFTEQFASQFPEFEAWADPPGRHCLGQKAGKPGDRSSGRAGEPAKRDAG